MMELARHSDPRLTMKRYSRVVASDVVAALDALPKLDAPDTETDAAAFATTSAFPCASPRPDARKDKSAADRNTLQTLGKPHTVREVREQAPVAQLDRASVFGTEG